MRTSARSALAMMLALAALAVSGATSAGSPAPASLRVGRDGGGSHPRFADVVAPPAIECGVQTGTGSGPDTPVAFAPCPWDDPVDRVPAPRSVTPTPGMAGVHSIGWDSATVGDDDRTVTVRFWSGIAPCYVLDHVDLIERPDAVTITLYEGSDPSAGDVACPEIAELKATTLTLSAPLAGRPLVDGADR